METYRKVQKVDNIGIEDEWPMVSIVITNYNSVEYIDRCLNTVFTTDYPNFEVIFVDNASSDGSENLVKDNFGMKTKLSIIRNSRNVGPAVAKNQGIRSAKGDYIALLDGDTWVDKNWLKEGISAMRLNQGVGMVQCKLVDMHHPWRLDYAGDYLSSYGFLVQRAVDGKIHERPDEVVEIFSVKDAGAIANKKALFDASLFDEDYFMYFEESDLCWRIWLMGYKVRYIPTSIVYHAPRRPVKFTSTQRKYLAQYYGTRNMIMSLIKNFGMKSLLRILPIHFLAWFSIVFLYIIKKRTQPAMWVLAGVIWNLRNFAFTWRKRQFVQALRKSTDDNILPSIMRKQSIKYFYDKARMWGGNVPPIRKQNDTL